MRIMAELFIIGGEYVTIASGAREMMLTMWERC